MTNGSYIELSFVAVVVNFIFVCIELRNLRKLPCVKYLMLYGFDLCAWGLVYLLYYWESDPELAINWYYARLVFTACMPALFLLFIFSYIFPSRPIARGIGLNLFLIPMATAVISLYPPLREYIYHSVQFVRLTPVKELVYQHGFWYYIHTGYSYLIFLLCTYFVLRQARKAAMFLRISYLCLFLAPLIVAVYNAVIILWGVSFSTVLIPATIAHYLFFWVAIQKKSAFFSLLVKDTAFEKLSSPGLILDTNHIVMECNQQMRQAFATFTTQYLGRPFPQLLEEWTRAREGLIKQDDNGRLLKVKDAAGGRYKYYRIKESDATDDKHRAAGIFVELPDVTTEEELIQELYNLVNRDKLTGVASRACFHSSLASLDIPANLPLCVIYGDVNKLKHANDTYGHETGDALIITVARILAAHCGENWLLARMGGDEFCILAPQTDAPAAEAFVAAVKQQCAQTQIVHAIVPSISLGYAVKAHAAVELDQVLTQADQRMYADKARRADARTRPAPAAQEPV